MFLIDLKKAMLQSSIQRSENERAMKKIDWVVCYNDSAKGRVGVKLVEKNKELQHVLKALDPRQ